MMKARSGSRLLIAVLVAVLSLGACSAEGGVGEKVISEAELEAQVAAQLAAEVNQPEPDIDCPGELEADVGAQTMCELSVEGDEARYGVSVQVTKVADGKATFDLKVADEPIGG